jgi:hypothetical protein
MNSKITQKNSPSNRYYQIRYRNDSFGFHEQHDTEKTVTICAGTEQSALNQFYQTFHDCFFIDIKEVTDEN